MRTNKALLAMAMGLALAACNTMAPKEVQTVQAVETGCVAVSTSLKALSVVQLTDAQKGAVVSALKVTTPVCSATTPPTLDALKMQAFMAAVDLLSKEAVR